MADPQDDASEHLRVIRHLMERATVYRAISAPTALAAALLTWAVAFFLNGTSPAAISPQAFYAVWAGVLASVGGFNTWLLWKDAASRGVSVLSSSAIHAGKAILPPLAAGGLISFLVLQESVVATTLCWMVFYGLALLATQSFAPASMKILGSVFLLAGLGIGTLLRSGAVTIPSGLDLCVANWMMAGTFGLLHLVYALGVGLTTGFRMRHQDRAPSLT